MPIEKDPSLRGVFFDILTVLITCFSSFKRLEIRR